MSNAVPVMAPGTQVLPVAPEVAGAASNTWLKSADLARLAGITERNARAGMQACLNGGTWRGCSLAVEEVPSPGGRVGVSYRCRIDSAPIEIQRQWALLNPASTGEPEVPAVQLEPDWSGADPRVVREHQIAQWKFDIVAAALEYLPRSSERGHVLRDAAAREHTHPITRRKVRYGLRTLETWVAKIEAAEGDIRALYRKPRAQSAGRLPLPSRKWQRAFQMNEDKRRKITEELVSHVKGLLHGNWPGWRQTATHASSMLWQLMLANGYTDAKPEDCCVERNFVENFAAHRIVGTRRHDAKTYFDKHRPRILRQRPDRPMKIVVGDVLVIDVGLRRNDGNEDTFTPRLVAWLDWANNRIFYTVILKKGVTQADVARSFVAMVEAWGLPEQIYLDNGPEYSWEPMMEGFRRLASVYQNFRALVRDKNGEPIKEENPIIRAQVRNAPAKTVEAVFSTLVNQHIAKIPGFFGGNRLKKRTHRLGKPPEPYPGTHADFLRDFDAVMKIYHNTPQPAAPDMDGLSPFGKLKQAVDGGFERNVVQFGALLFALSEEMHRPVVQGSISFEVGGEKRYYRHDVFDTYVGKQKVEVYVPKWDAERRVIVRHEGKSMTLFPETCYEADDRTGAVEVGRRIKSQNASLKALTQGVPRIDKSAEIRRHAGTLPAEPSVPAGPTLAFDEKTEAAADSIRNTPPMPLQPKRRLGFFEHVDEKTGQIVNFAPTEPKRRHDEEEESYWAKLGRRHTEQKRGQQ